MELGKIGDKKIEECCLEITDSLKLAKEIRPGQRNSLDALCRAYGINNSQRSLHGALLDAELLGDVFLGAGVGAPFLLHVNCVVCVLYLPHMN